MKHALIKCYMILNNKDNIYYIQVNVEETVDKNDIGLVRVYYWSYVVGTKRIMLSILLYLIDVYLMEDDNISSIRKYI